MLFFWGVKTTFPSLSLRKTILMDRSRRENSAEHSWHIALMTLILSEYEKDSDVDLFRVMKILLHNAIRFSPKKGKVFVNLINDSGCYRIVIKDYGKGINPDFIQKVYDEFTCFEDKEFPEWRGLSLPIARRIVEEHNGWIDINSIPGRETTFKINLPIVKSP